MHHPTHLTLRLLYFSCLLLIASCAATKPAANRQEPHNLMAEYSALQAGNPRSIPVEGGGVAYEFDGVDDGLLFDVNPLVGAAEFSIEVVLKPYAGYPGNSAFCTSRTPRTKSAAC